MSVYTPGPWYIKTNPIPELNGRLWGWVDANPPGEPDNSIAGVDVTWTQGQKSEANARLIAAAPELLEALNLMATIIDNMGDMPDGFIHPSPWKTLKCEEALTQARAAIAKVMKGDKE